MLKIVLAVGIGFCFGFVLWRMLGEIWAAHSGYSRIERVCGTVVLGVHMGTSLIVVGLVLHALLAWL